MPQPADFQHIVSKLVFGGGDLIYNSVQDFLSLQDHPLPAYWLAIENGEASLTENDRITLVAALISLDLPLVGEPNFLIEDGTIKIDVDVNYDSGPVTHHVWFLPEGDDDTTDATFWIFQKDEFDEYGGMVIL